MGQVEDAILKSGRKFSQKREVNMTDREKKQRNILEMLYTRLPNKNMDKEVDQALSELAKLDAIPASKEVEGAVRVCKNVLEDGTNGLSEQLEQALQTLLQAVKPKEEVGVDEVADDLELMLWGRSSKSLAKALLTKYSIARKG